MTDHLDDSEDPADEMAEYLQTFVDETEEQLDDLVETMLVLEQDSASAEDLNEAFRLIHSIKGSAGMMGFDNITVLTHHLENRFERFRSGTERLDVPTMNLVLRCIDFLRQCNLCLRSGTELGSSVELLDELKRLEEQALATASDKRVTQPDPSRADAGDPVEASASTMSSQHDPEDPCVNMVVRFRTGLQLADLKAQLIVARLEGMGEVRSTLPDIKQVPELELLEDFEIRIETSAGVERLRDAANVEGVESIEFPLGTPTPPGQESVKRPPASVPPDSDTEPVEPAAALSLAATKPDHFEAAPEAEPDSLWEGSEPGSRPEFEAEDREQRPSPIGHESPQQGGAVGRPAAEKPVPKVAETMRVDIDRLDNLMNLVGELVVNRARFVQISGQIDPALRNGSMLNRIRDFGEALRRTIENLEAAGDPSKDPLGNIQQLRAGLELLQEQSKIWDNGRHCVGQIGEAIDQLARVSHSLQRGVLDTRMVSVAPLFNRFKRVVRDLSNERGKKVNLQIRGEKTELDKRMVDELGDPLVHLVRNSIDHGLEPPDIRVARGKPERGTILLEACHSGNNIYIYVEDDGGGINVPRIKTKLVEAGVLSESAVEELSDEQTLDYIWHPGFSTAGEVTDVSGRGVGMDVVKTRIGLLNGTIDVESTAESGTRFTLRLPLTLAITNCLLIRTRNVIFSIPINNVREIVSINPPEILTAHRKRTIDVRGEFLPLLCIEDVFHWQAVDCGGNRQTPDRSGPHRTGEHALSVVILSSGGRTLGLQVDELLGSQDIVIKSLSDNFLDIRGLAGASILGSGSVCLMLDVGMVIDMAVRRTRIVNEEAAK